MEYLDGGDLESRIQGGTSPETAISLLKIIGNCLDFVHSKGIIHRDIKPANILFRSDNTLVLTDFGIAKHLDQDTSLTTDGKAMGSPDYLSPEQAECKPLDGRTDIYSLGIVLYEMLTGEKPYRGDSYIETVMAHITEPIPILPTHLECYQGLLERMIAKEPDERFDSAAHMVAFVDKIRKTTPVEQISVKIAGIVRRLRDSTPSPTIPILPAINARCELDKDPLDEIQQKEKDGFRAVINILATRSRKINQIRVMMGIIFLFIAGSVWVLDRSPEDVPLHSRESEIEQYLLKAKVAMDMSQLTAPAQDNAYFYYQNVIRLDPDHEVANQGLTDIANRYADLAENSIDRFQYVKAKHYVSEGIRVQPENTRLAALQQRTDAIKDVPTRFIKSVKSIFNQ